MGRSTFPKHALIVLSVLITATLLWADQPWTAKPYASWDAKDIQQIMTNSPWVVTATIQPSWTPKSAQSRTSGTGGAGPLMNPGTMGQSDSQKGVKVLFYWASSKLMRVASGRRGVLNGSGSESDVERYATTVNPEYAVAVAMQDMTPFEGKGPNDFQDACFLEGKKSKVKVAPTRAEFQKNGDQITDVVFFFPKTTSSGQATIASDETDAVFNLQVARTTLRADFKTKKMVDQFGSDL